MDNPNQNYEQNHNPNGSLQENDPSRAYRADVDSHDRKCYPVCLRSDQPR